MSKSMFIGVVLAALFVATLAQTQCLPQVRVTYKVKAFFNQTYNVCNDTRDELEALAGRITAELFSASTGLDASCSVTLDSDSVECEAHETSEDTEDEMTQSNSKGTKGGRKEKGRERSKKSKGDKLEFDVVIACTNGSDPCLLAESSSVSTIVDSIRDILELFQLEKMQSLTLDDMMVDVMIRRPKVERFCQVPSTLRRRKGKGRRRRPMTCSKCIILLILSFILLLFL